MGKQQPDMIRVYVTIALGLGWLLFLGLWLFYYATSFSIIQNIAILIISLVVVAAISVALWVPWAMKHGD